MGQQVGQHFSLCFQYIAYLSHLSHQNLYRRKYEGENDKIENSGRGGGGDENRGYTGYICHVGGTVWPGGTVPFFPYTINDLYVSHLAGCLSHLFEVGQRHAPFRPENMQ